MSPTDDHNTAQDGVGPASTVLPNTDPANTGPAGVAPTDASSTNLAQVGTAPAATGPTGVAPPGAVPNHADSTGAGPTGAGPTATTPASASPVDVALTGVVPTGAGVAAAVPAGADPTGVRPASVPPTDAVPTGPVLTGAGPASAAPVSVGPTGVHLTGDGPTGAVPPAPASTGAASTSVRPTSVGLTGSDAAPTGSGDRVTAKRITHWIGGKSWTGGADRVGDVHDPATGQVASTVDLASAEVVDRAVEVAGEAFTRWRDSSLAQRSSVMFAFRELLHARKGELAAIITAEHGKVLADAAGEVQRALENVEFACGIPHLLKGGFSENASSRVDVYSIQQPLGVVAVVSPFNFPAMVPLWFVPTAIACGNAVVLKPSEKDPSASVFLAELFAEAGLPDGVLNVVHGDKEAVDRLLVHPDVKAVSFVGSTPVARYVYETATARGKRVQALGGAKNHMVVLPDADLDLAADAAVSAGFGSAGERCMAISAVVAVDPVGDVLVAKIAERIAALKVGDGRRAGCDMGPLITGAHRDRVTSYLDSGVADGADLVVDGRDHAIDGAPDGFWLGPTLFDRVGVDMAVYRDEVFGPVLSVLRATGYDEALDLVNANPYGNGAAIFTNDGGAARRFQHEVEVGMVGVNVPIPVPVAHYSFGGWKDSLFGDSHAYGPEGVHFHTRTKVVTGRWLDPSHGGVNLGFPQNT